MAKKFFFVCAGIFMLALAYHLGATSATAQAPSNSVVASFAVGSGGYPLVVVTTNGDIYSNPTYCATQPWQHVSNVLGSIGPAPA
jgi:hypothetical protein